MPRVTRAAGAIPGGRFIHEIRAQFFQLASEANARTMKTNVYYFEGVMNAMACVTALDNPETRRIVVDAKQAQQFMEISGAPPVERFHLPFDQMYIEFTTPIDVGEQEPGQDDVLVAILINGDVDLEHNPGLPDGAVRIDFITRARLGREDWASQTFVWHRLTGETLGHPAKFMRAQAQGAPEYLDHGDISEYPPGTFDGIDVNKTWVAARTTDEWKRGWFERSTTDHGQFFAWLLTYMTAKGIVIVEEPMSRQVRRANARMKHRPSPWHIVTVDPTLIRDEERGEGTGRGHSYRYDVRGHLRFGRHPRADGTYTERVEWVRPHQRGLANAVYIPKTYHYDDKSPKVDVP